MSLSKPFSYKLPSFCGVLLATEKKTLPFFYYCPYETSWMHSNKQTCTVLNILLNIAIVTTLLYRVQ
jgi:hypothetical protein